MKPNMVAITMLVLLSACATGQKVQRINTPSGEPGYSVNCSGNKSDWGGCFKKAGEVCGDKGYMILDAHLEQGVEMASPYTHGIVGSIYQMVEGGARTTVNRSMIFKCRAGNEETAKKLIGRWSGQGLSSVAGKFNVAVTLIADRYGFTGVLTATTGFSGSMLGYVGENNSVELVAQPSNPAQCMLHFIGTFDGKDKINGQYSAIACNVNESGVIEMTRTVK